MSGQNIVNLGSPQGPMDVVRKKYVIEKFFKRGNPIDMDQKAIKTYCLQTKKATRQQKATSTRKVLAKVIWMKGHLVKNVRWPEEDYDLVNGAYVYFVANTKLSLEGGTMQGQIDMDQHSIRNINSNPQNEDEVVPKRWIENNFLNRNSPASTMATDLNMDGNHISYLRTPEQNHHAATKGYTDTKLSLLDGCMQGGIGMAGNRISHLGEPVQSNDAVRLSYANEFYLKLDGTNRIRGPLHAGGFQVIRVGNLCEEQDAVNLRTLQDSATSVSEQATAAADTVVGNGVANHAEILNRDLRTKSLDLDPQGIATKNFSMGEQYHIVGLLDPTLEHEVVNLRTLNQKV